jgi:hypothetical protein
MLCVLMGLAIGKAFASPIRSALRDIAVDATHVCWTARYGETTGVAKVEIGAGMPATLTSGDFNPEGIAVDATHVY